jgi:threonine dehydrogenase-like Zn-dependent dehydrogenase
MAAEREPATMLAVCKSTQDGAPVFGCEQRPVPRIADPHDVLIRIERIGICTSDVHVLHRTMHIPDGNIVGHEYSGTIAAVGPAVRDWRVGDRVVCELAVGYCGQCARCREGKYAFCPQKRPPGWASQGVYAEYAVMHERILHRLPEGVSFDVGAIAEPVAICVYGVLERARVRKGARVVVTGMGPIGLCTLLVLQDAGVADIICVTPTRHGRRRLDLAVELGAGLGLAAEAADVAGEIRRHFGGMQPDVVVDCSGATSAIAEGIRLLRKDGTFVGLGIAPREQVEIPFNTALLNALTIVFSCTSSHSAWQTTVGILERQKERLKKVITHQFPLEDWRSAYDAIEARAAIKALLVPPGR